MQKDNGVWEVRAPVNRILRSSIVDGPGNRAAVFLQGCNFDCVYCHNPETISLCRACGACVKVCPTGALSGTASGLAGGLPAESGAGAPAGGIRWEREKCALCDACLKACPYNASPRVRLMDPSEVMAEIEPSLAFIRGLTVSGGECTLYPEFLRALGLLCREKSLTFFLDSNGSYDYAGDPALMEVTGSVMLDVKADPENEGEYKRVTGRNSRDLLEKMEFLVRAGKLWEVRTVVSPGLFDAEGLVEKVCRRLAACLGNRETGFGQAPGGTTDITPRYKLIRYRPIGVRAAAAVSLAEPDMELMDALALICAKHGIKAVVV